MLGFWLVICLNSASVAVNL